MKQLERVTVGLLTALKSSCLLQRRDTTDCQECPYAETESCNQLLLDALVQLRHWTPTPPIKSTILHGSYLWRGCPECKRMVQRGWVACPACGQLLQWDEEDEAQPVIMKNEPPEEGDSE